MPHIRLPRTLDLSYTDEAAVQRAVQLAACEAHNRDKLQNADGKATRQPMELSRQPNNSAAAYAIQAHSLSAVLVASAQ